MPSPRRRALVVALSLGVFLLAYGLSIGAAARLAFEAPASEPLMAAYSPLFAAADQNDTLRKGLFWYLVEAWGCPAPVARRLMRR